MGAQPTGTRTADGALELRRDFEVSAGRVWHYLSYPSRTALWFGPWHGDPLTGAVEVVMTVEDGAPSEQVQILQCDPLNYQLKVRAGEGVESWQLELQVLASDGGSQLRFRMPELAGELAGSVGPGWEFYLDRLVAAVTGGNPSMIQFQPDYFPAQSRYYEQLFNP